MLEIRVLRDRFLLLISALSFTIMIFGLGAAVKLVQKRQSTQTKAADVGTQYVVYTISQDPLTGEAKVINSEIVQGYAESVAPIPTLTPTIIVAISPRPTLAPTLTTTIAPRSIPITVQAESGILTSPFVKITSDSKINHNTTDIRTALTGGLVVYKINIPVAGSYYLKINKLAASDAQNSLFINFGQDPKLSSTPNSMIWDIPVNTDLTRYQLATVSWRGNSTTTTPQFPTKVWNLISGVNYLYIRGREPQVKLDYITVTPQSSTALGITTTSTYSISSSSSTTNITQPILFNRSIESFPGENANLSTQEPKIAIVKVLYNPTTTYTLRSSSGSTLNLTAPATTNTSAASFLPTGINQISSAVARKVMVIEFNPILESHDYMRLTEFMSWNNPSSLENNYISTINGIKNTSYQVVDRRVIDDIPTKLDGYRYDDSIYINCIKGLGPCHAGDYVDYNKILSQYGVCDKANSGTIDELWLWGGPYFGYAEAVMAGPGAFITNGFPVSGTSCNRKLNIMGFNYERDTGSMLHSMGHRVEGVVEHYKNGQWNYRYNSLPQSYPTNNTTWDLFTARGFDVGTPSGCGLVHGFANNNYAPPDYVNGNYYDWSSGDTDTSRCANWPYNTTSAVSCSYWGCNEGGFLRMWLSKLPDAWWGRVLDYDNPPVDGGEGLINPPPTNSTPGAPTPTPTNSVTGQCGCGSSCGTGATCAFNTGLGCNTGLDCVPNTAGYVCYSQAACASNGYVCPVEKNTQFWYGCPGEPYAGCNGLTGWVGGDTINIARPNLPFDLDVNCFANSGQGFTDARIEVRGPSGAIVASSNSMSLRNYMVTTPGIYTARCISRSDSSCVDMDSFTARIITPTPTPYLVETTRAVSMSPTPPPGCYYQSVQCIQAPCYPILVCPSGTPTSTSCTIGQPVVSLVSPTTNTSFPSNTTVVSLSASAQFKTCNNTRYREFWTRDITAGTTFSRLCYYSGDTADTTFNCNLSGLISTHTYQWYVLARNESLTTTSSTNSFVVQ
jgi:hypothetical protein